MLTKLYKKEIRPILEPVYQFGILALVRWKCN